MTCRIYATLAWSVKQTGTEHRFLRIANYQVQSPRFKVFTWHTYMSTDMCFTTRNCCSHDENFTGKLQCHRHPFKDVVNCTFWTLQEQLHFTSSKMVEVASKYWVKFHLSSTADVSISKGKHWKKESASDKSTPILRDKVALSHSSLLLCQWSIRYMIG